MVNGDGSYFGGPGGGPGQPPPGGSNQGGQGDPWGFRFNEGVEEYRIIDGKPVLVRGSRYDYDPLTGFYRLILVSENWLEDSSGMPYLAQEHFGRSWTNKKLSTHTAFKCLNPYRDHGPRLCCIEDDGFIPPTYPEYYFYYYGRVLCSECDKKNDRRILLRKLFGWLGYLPDIY